MMNILLNAIASFVGHIKSCLRLIRMTAIYHDRINKNIKPKDYNDHILKFRSSFFHLKVVIAFQVCGAFV